MSQRRRPLLMLGAPTSYHLTQEVALVREALDEQIEEDGEQQVFFDEEGEPFSNDLAYLMLEAVEIWGFTYWPHPGCDRPNLDGTCSGHPPG